MSAFFLLFCYNVFGDIMNPFTMKLRRKTNYFEGYYVRVIDQNKSFNKAFIFGMTSNKKDPHAFMQLVDGDNHSTKYYRFDLDDFNYDQNSISMPGIRLTSTSISIELDDFSIKGEFTNIVGLQKRHGSNSAMSFLHILPMKTYQEIVIMDSVFTGSYIIDSKTTSLNGTTYIEKTYGYHFPRNWIWIQSSTFDKDVLLSCSIGEAKMIGIPFKGYVISLIYKGEQYRFATYLKDKIIVKQEPGKVEIIASNKKTRLAIKAISSKPITLVGPGLKSEMIMDVFESITSNVEIELTNNSNKTIVKSIGTHVGMENMYEN